MVDRMTQLEQLEQIARLRAERELKSFSVFNAYMIQARQRAEGLRAALSQSYDSTAPLSLPEARTANALAGRAARELRQAEGELQRLQPRFQLARHQAAQEFGRAEALLILGMAEAQRRRKDHL